MGDIVKFEGGVGVVGTLGRSGWSWKQRLTQKDWPWLSFHLNATKTFHLFS